MNNARKKLGQKGEEIIAAYLRRDGTKIIERNFRCRYGEVDIVAERDKEYIFIEVRTRRSLQFGTPEESITNRKLSKLARTAEFYLHKIGKPEAAFRIDVAALYFDPRGTMHLNYLISPFDLS